MNSKKLNVKWVTEVIGEDYKNWRAGDTYYINAQTGTGKTYFILNTLLDNKVQTWEELIYICNRVELCRQIKLDLLKKYFNELETMGIEMKYITKGNANYEIDLEWLDKLNKIGNVTITTYHKIANGRKHRVFNVDEHDKYYLEKFNYIVADECQFFLTDASFNKTTFFAFDDIVATNYKAVKVFLSATMDEVCDLIDEYISKEAIHSFLFEDKEKYIDTYNTGKDYSYLNVKYFKKLDSIISEIDKTEEKWLIFVSGIDKGNELKQQLDNLGVSCEFIRAGEESDEKKNITTKSKFNCRVLIATKVIDNGVNIKDLEVKHLVVMAWDKTTFIQEIGRLRIDIENAHEITLYIRCASKKSFQNLVNGNLTAKGKEKYKGYKDKLLMVDVFYANVEIFKELYNNDLKSTEEDLFYLDAKTNKWTLNKLGLMRLELDNEFAERMIKEFEVDKDFAFIKEQLNWLGLADTFNEGNLIDKELDVVLMKDLEMFLSDSYENGKLYTKDYFIEVMTGYSESDDRLKLMLNKLGTNGNRNKGQSTFNKLFSKLFEKGFVGSKFIVSSQPKYKTVDKKRIKETYWVVTKEEN